MAKVYDRDITATMLKRYKSLDIMLADVFCCSFDDFIDNKFNRWIIKIYHNDLSDNCHKIILVHPEYKLYGMWKGNIIKQAVKGYIEITHLESIKKYKDFKTGLVIKKSSQPQLAETSEDLRMVFGVSTTKPVGKTYYNKVGYMDTCDFTPSEFINRLINAYELVTEEDKEYQEVILKYIDDVSLLEARIKAINSQPKAKSEGNPSVIQLAASAS